MPARRSLSIVLLVVSLVLLGVGGYFSAQKSTPTCFTVSDYQAFYGTDPEDGTRNPKDSFFTTSYQFLSDSTTIDTAESYQPEPDAARIAKLLKDTKNKPAIITLSAVYNAANDGAVLAEKRLASIKTVLTQAGISPDSMHTTATPYDSTDDEEEKPDTDSVTLTLASTQDCRE